MKHPFFGSILLALPLSLLAFTACGDESVVNSNIKQISEDEPQSSESLSSSSAKSSSSSAKSSEKKSSSSKAEEASAENDIVETEGDLPRCSIKREGMEVYVKEEKNLYTCEEGEWVPEKKTVESSSSSKKYSSSSNKNPFDIVDGTSSSAIYIDVDFSSSSSVKVITGLGMCEPVTTPIDKGTGSTKWKFTPNMNAGYTAIDFAKANYAWNFGAGAIPATDATPSTSAPVTYTNSGIAVASVTVTIGGASETIQCSPLQVNGDPIMGCKCTAEAASVDFTATPDVTWSVTGCTSVSSPLTYNWNGADGGATFTNSFTAAMASYAPTLKVGNADNTVIDVPCSAVRVTEGAEYVIKEFGSGGAIDLPAGSSIVVLETEGHSNMVFCNANGSVNGSVNKEKIYGQYYVSIRMTAGTLVPGARLEFTLDVPATCGVM